MGIGSVMALLLRRKRPEQPAEPDETVEQRAEKAKAGAQAIANKLPAAVMPKAGLAEDKRRKAMIDKQLAEGSQ